MLIEQARALARTGMKKHLRVLPMYAGLPSPEQLKVFERVPHTVRKVSSCVCLSSHRPEGCLQHTGIFISSHHGTVANAALREAFYISHQCLSAFKLGGNQERVPCLPFSSLIIPRHVSSRSPVCLINSAVFKCLHITLYLSSLSYSFLHSELLYFYLFLSFCDLKVHGCFLPVMKKLVTEWASAIFSSKEQVQTCLILVGRKALF